MLLLLLQRPDILLDPGYHPSKAEYSCLAPLRSENRGKDVGMLLFCGLWSLQSSPRQVLLCNRCPLVRLSINVTSLQALRFCSGQM